MTTVYLVTLVLLFLLWKVMFQNQRKIERILRTRTAKQATVYERVDKRFIHQEHVKVLEDIERYKKWGLVTDGMLSSLRPALNTLGIHDVETYVHTSVKQSVQLTLGGIAIAGFSLLFDVMFNTLLKMHMEFLSTLIQLLGVVFILFGVVSLLAMKPMVTVRLKEHIKSVEDGLNKLFFHVYPYYSNQSSTNYRLADVLGKFTTTNPQMAILLSTVINDCKSSEEIALQSVIENYGTSVRVVEFASKLLKCVEGNKLGPKYLTSMYDQLIAAEDRLRDEKETKKYELYIAIMLGSLVVTALIQLVGLSIELY